MAEQVAVCVRNLSDKVIEVVRELVHGTHDLNLTIASGNEDTTLLPEPGVLLIISTPDAPSGMNTQTCPFKVTLNEDVVEWSVMDDYHWRIQIADNIKFPEVPLYVNVDVGGLSPTT